MKTESDSNQMHLNNFFDLKNVLKINMNLKCNAHLYFVQQNKLIYLLNNKRSLPKRHSTSAVQLGSPCDALRHSVACPALHQRHIFYPCRKTKGIVVTKPWTWGGDVLLANPEELASQPSRSVWSWSTTSHPITILQRLCQTMLCEVIWSNCQLYFAGIIAV